MWPTMLATAAERFPRGGALLIGLMGTAGTLSITFVLPAMGQILIRKKSLQPAAQARSRHCSPDRNWKEYLESPRRRHFAQ